MSERQAELQGKYDQLKGRFRNSEQALKAQIAEVKACNHLLAESRMSFKARDADATALRVEVGVLASRLSAAESSASESAAELAEAKAKLAETTVSLKEAKAESEAQYTKGFDDAGDSYEEQVKAIAEQVFQEGWKAALKVLNLEKSSPHWTAIPARADADLDSDAEDAEAAAAEVTEAGVAGVTTAWAESEVAEASTAEVAVAGVAEVTTAWAESEVAEASTAEVAVAGAAEAGDGDLGVATSVEPGVSAVADSDA